MEDLSVYVELRLRLGSIKGDIVVGLIYQQALEDVFIRKVEIKMTNFDGWHLKPNFEINKT